VAKRLLTALLAVTLLAAATIAWTERPRPGGELIRRALDASTSLRQAQTLITVNGVAEARRFQQPLSLAAGAPIAVPDLDNLGYRLTALRFGEGGAELFYQGRDGETLTLCLHPSDGSVHLDRYQRGALRLVLWQDERLTMTASAELPATRLQKLAAHAYAALQP